MQPASLHGRNSHNYYQGYAVQLSNGDGTFAAPALTVFSSSASLPTTTLPPNPVNVADLNGDKIPDLIVYVPPVAASGGTAATPAALEVLLGNSDGTFQKPQTITVASIPANLPLAVGDINGDGKVDLVALGGTGTFGTPTTLLIEVLAIGGPTEGLALVDFNGDGKLDLAISGFLPPYDTGIFPGNGDGTFQTLPTGASDASVMPVEALQVGGGSPATAVDINGVGKTDLVTTDTFLIQPSTSTSVAPPSATTVTLTATPTTVTAGGSVAFSATVAAASGSGTPTGTVTFSDGSTQLGTGTLNSSGQVTYSTSSLAVGTHSITAAYGGNANFAASTSSAVTVTVTASVPADFSISLSPASGSVAQGSTATTAITITPSGGFNSQVSFACTGLPAYSTCSSSPATVTPSGTAAASTTLTLATSVATASIREPHQPNGRRSGDAETFLALVLLGLSGLVRQRRKWSDFRCRSTLLSVLLVAGVATAVVGCGGGGNSSGSGGSIGTSTTTPAGTSTVTVTATAGSLSKTATFTFTVQ